MTDTLAAVFDDTPCQLGEGAFWLAEQQVLAWFDINDKNLYLRGKNQKRTIEFPDYAGCAGRLEDGRLIVATQRGLCFVDLSDGSITLYAAMAELGGAFRPNDGRADPWGGFWFSRMSLEDRAAQSAIYRYYRGEIRQLHDGLTVPNSICFSPLDRSARFSDTRARQIFRQELDQETGWPVAPARLCLDFTEAGLKPDGAVFDTEGHIWVAHWGAGCVVRYDPAGKITARVDLPTENASCPAFGGRDLCDLFITTAQPNVPATGGNSVDAAGKTYRITTRYKGVGEPHIIL